MPTAVPRRVETASGSQRTPPRPAAVRRRRFGDRASGRGTATTYRHRRTDWRRMVFQGSANERRSGRQVQAAGGPGRAVAVDRERIGVRRRRLSAVVLHFLHVVLQMIRFQRFAQRQFLRVSDVWGKKKKKNRNETDGSRCVIVCGTLFGFRVCTVRDPSGR